MSNENLFESIKENLNGQAGQPMVLGVCQALAQRFEREPWVLRAGFIVLAVMWTGLTLIGYVALGLLMQETEARTRGVFQGLLITLRECIDRCISACRDFCGPHSGRGNRNPY